MQLSRQVNIRVSGSDLSTLIEEADRHRVSLSEFIRIAAMERAKQLRGELVTAAKDIDGTERDGTKLVVVKLYPPDLKAITNYSVANEFDALSDAVRGAARRGLVDRGYLVMAGGAQPDLEF